MKATIHQELHLSGLGFPGIPFPILSKDIVLTLNLRVGADVKNIGHSLPLMKLIIAASLESLVLKMDYYLPPVSYLQMPTLVGCGTEKDISLDELSFCSEGS